MKVALIFEYIFRSQHNHSEFAHFCLLLFLGFLFLNFMQSYKPQLDEKMALQKKKKESIAAASAP
jgi:hypothetical protein